MKKILIIVGCVVVLLAIGGLIIVKMALGQFDQVKLQYDQEVISAHRRVLDFEPYHLDDFESYDLIHEYVHGKDIEVIQKALLDRTFTVESLCLYYLTRIQEYESYHAVIQLNPSILEEAKVLDEKIEKGEVKDLFGVIVLIKDNIASATMNTSTGALALKDLTTTRDAMLVHLLKESDALILGKANLSEWSNFMSQPSSSGFSVLGGQTKNAYGKYDVGGSSSGSSVAAALNLSTVTIGTETAGSLIFPAGQNSVVALKPTMGLLSRDLIIPISEAQDTAGVIARSVKDLNLVYNKLIHVDSNDEATQIVWDYDPHVVLSKDYLKGKRLGLVSSSLPELQLIANQMKSLGAEIVEIELAENAYSADMMSVLNHGMQHDVKNFLNHPDVNTTFDSLQAIIKWNEQDASYMPFGQSLLKGAVESNHENIDVIIETNRQITKDAIDRAMTEYQLDAILSISNELSGVYAPAGYPALTVPSGYRTSGEPFGLTLVGRALDDQNLINMAYAYEVNFKVRKEVE